MSFPKVGVEAEVEGYSSFMGKIGKMGSAIGGVGKMAAKAAIGGVAVLGAAVVGLGVGFVKLASDATELQGIQAAFKGIATAAGSSQEEMLAALQKGSLGMVTQKDLMATYNEAAQLVGATFAGDLPIAMASLSKVSAATGQDMGFMIDSLVKGVGRMSPMILDNLGIQVTLADATANAAVEFGKEADELSKAELQTGMMNVVLEKLKENTAEMPEVAGTAAQAQAAFGVALKDTKDQIGLALLPTFTKLTTAVGGFASKILPKLVKVFKDKVVPVLEKVIKVAGFIIEAFKGVVGVAKNLLKWDEILGIEEFANVEGMPKTLQKIAQTLGELVAKAIDFGKKFKEAMSGVAETVKTAMGVVVEWLKTNIPAAIAIVSQVWTTTLLPAIQTVGDFITGTIIPAFIDLKDWLSVAIPAAIETLSAIWTDTLQPAMETIVGFIKDNLKPILVGLAAVVGVVLVAALYSMATAATAAATATLAALAPIVIPLVAIGVAAALLYKAWTTNWNGIRDKVTTVWQEKILPALTAVKDFLLTEIPRAIETVKEWWAENSDEILEKAEDVWGIIQDVISTVSRAIEIAVKIATAAIQGNWKGAWEAVKAVVSQVWPIIQGAIQTAIDAIVPILATAWETIKTTAATVWPKIQKAIGDVWNTLTTEVIPTALETIKTLLTAAWEKLKDPIIPDLWEAIKDAIAVVWDALWKEDGIIPKALAGIQTIIETAWEALKDPIIPALWEAIKDAIEVVWDALWKEDGIISKALAGIQTIIETAWEALKDPIIPALWEAIMDAIESVWDALWKEDGIIPKALAGLKTIITDAWETLRDETIPDLWEAMMDAIEDVWNTLKDETIPQLLTELGVVINTELLKIEQIFIDTANYMITVGHNIVANLRKGIEEKWQELVDWVNDRLGDLAGLWPGSEPKDTSSPLYGLHKRGAAIIGNIMDGMNSAWPDLMSNMENLLDGLVKKIQEDLGYIPATLDFTAGFLEFGGDLGGIAGKFIRRYEDEFTDPLSDEIDHLTERAEFFKAEWIAATEAEDVPGMETNRNLYLRFYNELAEKTREYEATQQRILDIEQKRADLKFLQSQLDLLDLIAEYELDAESILGGLELGLDANLEALLDSLSLAMQAIINQANEDLGIASPSTEFMRIGEQAMAGMAMGIERMAALPIAQSTITSQGMIDNSRHVSIQAGGNTISNGMDQAAFESGIRRIVNDAMRG